MSAFMRVTASFAACFFFGAQGLKHGPEHLVHQMTDHRCRLMCQPHGMQALGASFASIKSPTECMKKCDDVYTTKPKQYGGILNNTIAAPPAAHVLVPPAGLVRTNPKSQDAPLASLHADE